MGPFLKGNDYEPISVPIQEKRTSECPVPMTLMCPPHFLCLKLHPQCNSVEKWNFSEAIKRTLMTGLMPLSQEWVPYERMDLNPSSLPLLCTFAM
jgi:hypothetical protein